MGLKIKKRRALPIGIDPGSSCLKIAQLGVCDNSLELLAAGSVQLPVECLDDPEGRMAFHLGHTRRILRSACFRGRKAVLSVPASTVTVQIVKVPFGMPNVVDAAVRGELRGRLEMPIADAVVRHFPTGGGDDGLNDLHDRLVVAVAREDLKPYLAMAREAQLDVVGVDVEMCAVAECFGRLMRRAADASRVLLLLDIGAVSTQLVLTRGPRITFARNLNFGGRMLDAHVGEAMGIDINRAGRIRRQAIAGDLDVEVIDDLFRLLDGPVARIVEQIGECLVGSENTYRGPAPERIVFVGGQAHDKRLCDAIAAGLKMPAETGDPLAGIRLPLRGGDLDGLDPQHPHPSWAVAIGLGLGAAA